jgi:hypothetical protein
LKRKHLTLSNLSYWESQLRILWLARQVAAHAHPDPAQKPAVFFNATTRIYGLSQNAAFSMLTTCGLRLAGVPVVQFICHTGMSHCVLGTDREDYTKLPPCKACIRQSKRIYSAADTYWFDFHPDSNLKQALQNLSIAELSAFEYPFTIENNIPLGRLVLPAFRWALRRHTLPDDESTRYLLRSYILSAYSIAPEFDRCLEQTKPAAAVIFNGIMYPEAAARWAAQQRRLRVITYEVSFQRFSSFFTDGEATAYPIHIPEEFELDETQNARLDAYLEKRFQGQFSMAGIRFWPEMRRLDEAFLQKAAQFRQIVPVFTNVIYDTSQIHANKVFEHMFAWLDAVLELIHSHPDTLFVIRAHPDEMRPGTAKVSRETVHDWVIDHGLKDLPNVVFIDSQEFISSYELIQRAKFVMVYNSSIGMEATLMGTAVLCAGKARYTQYPIVFFPQTPSAFIQTAQEFLAAEKIEVPADFQRNARRFLYYQLYRASLSYENYLADSERKGFVKLRPFSWRALLPENFPALRVILKGLNSDPAQSHNQLFLVEE